MFMYRMIAMANPQSPVAPGTFLVTDNVTARTQPYYAVVEISGTTAQRPVAGTPDFPNLAAGSSYYDTTLTKTIYWDGAHWRDPNSGTVV
jgi:hypothetical protein